MVTNLLMALAAVVKRASALATTGLSEKPLITKSTATAAGAGSFLEEAMNLSRIGIYA